MKYCSFLLAIRIGNPVRHKTLFYNYITRMREHIENRAEYLAAEMLLKESGLNIVEAATLALELVQLCGGSRCSMRRARKAIELGAEELKNGEQTVSFAAAVDETLKVKCGRRPPPCGISGTLPAR